MEAAREITVLDNDPNCAEWLRSSSHLHVLHRPDVRAVARSSRIFVLSLATKLNDVAGFIREANRLNHLRGLLVHADVEESWVNLLITNADLRTLRNLLVHRASGTPKRILNAWSVGAEHDLIAEATVTDGRLLICSCAFDMVNVPFDSIPALARLHKTKRAHFEVASDGSYINWPDANVHLDLEAFRVAVDPTVRDKARAERLRHDRRFGAAVAAVREEKDLSQTDVDGVSARQIRRIEAGEFFPRMATLECLARAHNLRFKEYLDTLAAKMEPAGKGVGQTP